MHTVLLLTTLAWLCYLGAWLLLDFSLRNRLQVTSLALMPRHINILCPGVPVHVQIHVLLARVTIMSCILLLAAICVSVPEESNKAICVS